MVWREKAWQRHDSNQGKPAMKTTHQRLLGLATAVLFVIHFSLAASAQDSPTHYVNAAQRGATLRNLASKKGQPVLEVGAGGILAVYGQNAGFLDVEVPGGTQVWVYGRSLKTTDVPGVLEVTRPRVAMRPLPVSEIRSYPMPQYLDVGDRVWVIARNDTTKAMNEDWIRVWSPPGARAWVRAEETVALKAGVSGAQAWKSAVRKILDSRKPLSLKPAVVTPAAAPVSTSMGSPKATQETFKPASAEAHAALAEADRLFMAARSLETKDFGPARAAYERVLVLAPKGSIAVTAQRQLDQIKLFDDLAKLRTEVEAAEATRSAEATRLESDLEEARLRRSDPLVGRYQVRGWLEARKMLGEDEPLYFIRWAGEDQSELISSDGRYDLSLYVGFELGVVGGASRAPIPASVTSNRRPVQYDVLKLEVISGRGSN